MKFYNIIVGGVHADYSYNSEYYHELPLAFHWHKGDMTEEMSGIVRLKPHIPSQPFSSHIEDYSHSNVAHDFPYPILLQMLKNFLDVGEFGEDEYYSRFTLDDITPYASKYFNMRFVRYEKQYDEKYQQYRFSKYESTMMQEMTAIHNLREPDGCLFNLRDYSENSNSELIDLVDKRIIGYLDLPDDYHSFGKSKKVPIWVVCIDIDVEDSTNRKQCKTFRTTPILTDDSNVGILLELIRRDMDKWEIEYENTQSQELERLKSIVRQYDYEEEKENDWIAGKI